MSLDAATAADHIGHVWDADIVNVLHDYIAIPNLSPAFDPGWAGAGHMDRAVALLRDWCAARPIPGLTVSVHGLPGRTPLIVMEVPPAGGGGPADDTVVLYGHLDKQPEMTGWRADLGPWLPVVEGDRLYGRGGADDGYAAFAALTAIEALHAGGGAHARLVVLIEASEESGSPDLPAHVQALSDRIGSPSLVVCLDSGCSDWERLWVTTSLRGNLVGTLAVDLLREGVHSGKYGGVVASSVRVIRQLLDRIEDARIGEVLIPEAAVAIPPDRRREAERTAAVLADPADGPPLVPGARTVTDEPVELLLNRAWRASLAYVGADGFLPIERAGNVLRPHTALKLSLRLPPTADGDAVAGALQRTLTAEPPYGAQVAFTVDDVAGGWNAPSIAPWLDRALTGASERAFGQGYATCGEGGTIPFMGMLGAQFPAAQFLVTGVLGPETNAHGPNEFLHLPTARRLTAVVADVLDAHARRDE
jgi:acetylornithine deacetylase/succinyl-diaminopimelate desuccinylase-like protein